MTRTHPRGRGPVAASIALLALLAAPGLATAHAELETSDPEDSATVEGTPTGITADFTEALGDGSRIVLRTASGEVIAEGGIDEADEARLILDPPTLVPGEYQVRWTARADDGHVERGSFSFTVVAPPTPSPSPTPPPTEAPSVAPSPVPTVAVSPAPSPTGDAGEPTSSTTDALVPIIAALAILAILGGYLLSRRRTSARP